MAREELGDFGRAVPRDEGYFSDFSSGVYNVQETDEFVRAHAGSDFDPDRIGYAPEELDVCATELPGAIADPEEVCGGRVERGAGLCCHPRGCCGVSLGGVLEVSSERLLVFQGETFVAGVDICCFDTTVVVDAYCAHEAECVFDCVHDSGVLFFD